VEKDENRAQSPNKILKWKPSARRRRGEVPRPCLKPPVPATPLLPPRGVSVPRFSFHQWATCLFSDFAASSTAQK